MSGIECKVLACICRAAKEIETGNTLIAYRRASGEVVDFHLKAIELIKTENAAIFGILNEATGMDLLPQVVTREALSVVMIHGYEAIIQNEDRFTEAQLLSVIDHANKAEAFGKRWNDVLLSDAGASTG